MNDFKIQDRQIFKFSHATLCWEPINFQDLKDGDIFKIIDGEIRYVNAKTGDNIWRALGLPYQNESGIWEIKTYW